MWMAFLLNLCTEKTTGIQWTATSNLRWRLHDAPYSPIINNQSSNQQSQYCFSNFSDVEQKIKDVKSNTGRHLSVLRPSETEESCVCWLLGKSQVFTLCSISPPGQHALCRAVPRGSGRVTSYNFVTGSRLELKHSIGKLANNLDWMCYGVSKLWNEWHAACA